MPLFFASNIILGRVAIGDVEPWTLAFIRWTATSLILFPFALDGIRTHGASLWLHRRRIVLLAFLGMWICGAVVYLALRYTSATNVTLIYTSSPVFILLIQAAFQGRKITGREILGIVIAIAGVTAIVVHGDVNVLLELQFNLGDLMIAVAAIAWACYSVLLNHDDFESVPTLTLFCVISGCGGLLLLPFALFEVAYVASLPTATETWTSIAGIVLIASLLAFSSYQFGVKRLGAAITGIALYLLPVYGVALAMLVLGEQFQPYHAVGIVLVLSGVLLATMPKFSD